MSQSILSPQYSITDGPSKYDLMSSLFEKKRDVRRSLSVTFEVEILGEIQVLINGAEREDGSGESWNFHGYTVEADRSSRNVKGYFQTSRRRGYIHFVLEK